ncbi:hypothetical protein DSCW_55460 [Desulfosarcina widdelii]|uniref:Uncharacterized protein n=1 Tax=Desulfosarcina widdelii TaxID=947919 RepID=A0A5K7ZD69_9BACT|nr:hypothetical protein [Desulfosarcina widdelii]BBO78129.1 hypothetical protein DSCW_55460 [Desulfosarcina widdelii]
MWRGCHHDYRRLTAVSAFFSRLDPNVVKAGAIQSQGVKGAAVVIYCNPLATPDLDCSGFPVRGTT